VEESIYKFAKKGMTPSQIGVILRDSHGIAQVKSITGSKILRILKAHGMALFPLIFFQVFVAQNV
jgi:small subunit ribosomal protein S13e